MQSLCVAMPVSACFRFEGLGLELPRDTLQNAVSL